MIVEYGNDSLELKHGQVVTWSKHPETNYVVIATSYFREDGNYYFEMSDGKSYKFCLATLDEYLAGYDDEKIELGVPASQISITAEQDILSDKNWKIEYWDNHHYDLGIDSGRIMNHFKIEDSTARFGSDENRAFLESLNPDLVVEMEAYIALVEKFLKANADMKAHIEAEVNKLKS